MEMNMDSPLPGCYLLVILGEPLCDSHKEKILQRVAKGLLSWDTEGTQCDLKHLEQVCDNLKTSEKSSVQSELLLQHSTEKLAVEVLFNPQIFTLKQCLRNLLLSPTGHKHIIHAGYSFTGSGSWILSDGIFRFNDFVDQLCDPSVTKVLSLYPDGSKIKMHLHCSPIGDWVTHNLDSQSFSSYINLSLNPPDSANGVPGASNLLEFIEGSLESHEKEELLEPSPLIGNIRFERPTMYVFPSGQGDCSLFGVTGFTMLVDGGFSRVPCFWKFVRHIERLDSIMLTRINESNVWGILSLLRGKQKSSLYLKIGYVFCNIVDKAFSDCNGSEGKVIGDDEVDGGMVSIQSDPNDLTISIIEVGNEIAARLKSIGCKPHKCLREPNPTPLTLYHKVGHGTLEMYILSPPKDSRLLKDFMAHWNSNRDSLPVVRTRSASKHGGHSGHDIAIPISDVMSICCLLIWKPADPSDRITRILFPGSAPQSQIMEGLALLKDLTLLQQKVCTGSTLQAHQQKHQQAKYLKTSIKSSTVKISENVTSSSISKSSTRYRSVSPTIRKSKVNYAKQISTDLGGDKGGTGDSSESQSSPVRRRTTSMKQQPDESKKVKQVTRESVKKTNDEVKKSSKSVSERKITTRESSISRASTAAKANKKGYKPTTVEATEENTKARSVTSKQLRSHLASKRPSDKTSSRTINGDKKGEIKDSDRVTSAVETDASDSTERKRDGGDVYSEDDHRDSGKGSEDASPRRLPYLDHLRDEVEPDSLESCEIYGNVEISKDSLEQSEDEVVTGDSRSTSQLDHTISREDDDEEMTKSRSSPIQADSEMQSAMISSLSSNVSEMTVITGEKVDDSASDLEVASLTSRIYNNQMSRSLEISHVEETRRPSNDSTSSFQTLEAEIKAACMEDGEDRSSIRSSGSRKGSMGSRKGSVVDERRESVTRFEALDEKKSPKGSIVESNDSRRDLIRSSVTEINQDNKEELKSSELLDECQSSYITKDDKEGVQMRKESIEESGETLSSQKDGDYTKMVTESDDKGSQEVSFGSVVRRESVEMSKTNETTTMTLGVEKTDNDDIQTIESQKTDENVNEPGIEETVSNDIKKSTQVEPLRDDNRNDDFKFNGTQSMELTQQKINKLDQEAQQLSQKDAESMVQEDGGDKGITLMSKKSKFIDQQSIGSTDKFSMKEDRETISTENVIETEGGADTSFESSLINIRKDSKTGLSEGLITDGGEIIDQITDSIRKGSKAGIYATQTASDEKSLSITSEIKDDESSSRRTSIKDVVETTSSIGADQSIEVQSTTNQSEFNQSGTSPTDKMQKESRDELANKQTDSRKSSLTSVRRESITNKSTEAKSPSYQTSGSRPSISSSRKGSQAEIEESKQTDSDDQSADTKSPSPYQTKDSRSSVSSNASSRRGSQAEIVEDQPKRSDSRKSSLADTRRASIVDQSLEAKSPSYQTKDSRSSVSSTASSRRGSQTEIKEEQSIRSDSRKSPLSDNRKVSIDNQSPQAKSPSYQIKDARSSVSSAQSSRRSSQAEVIEDQSSRTASRKTSSASIHKEFLDQSSEAKSPSYQTKHGRSSDTSIATVRRDSKAEISKGQISSGTDTDTNRVTERRKSLIVNQQSIKDVDLSESPDFSKDDKDIEEDDVFKDSTKQTGSRKSSLTSVRRESNKSLDAKSPSYQTTGSRSSVSSSRKGSQADIEEYQSKQTDSRKSFSRKESIIDQSPEAKSPSYQNKDGRSSVSSNASSRRGSQAEISEDQSKRTESRKQSLSDNRKASIVDQSPQAKSPSNQAKDSRSSVSSTQPLRKSSQGEIKVDRTDSCKTSSADTDKEVIDQSSEVMSPSYQTKHGRSSVTSIESVRRDSKAEISKSPISSETHSELNRVTDHQRKSSIDVSTAKSIGDQQAIIFSSSDSQRLPEMASTPDSEKQMKQTELSITNTKVVGQETMIKKDIVSLNQQISKDVDPSKSSDSSKDGKEYIVSTVQKASKSSEVGTINAEWKSAETKSEIASEEKQLESKEIEQIVNVDDSKSRTQSISESIEEKITKESLLRESSSSYSQDDKQSFESRKDMLEEEKSETKSSSCGKFSSTKSDSFDDINVELQSGKSIDSKTTEVESWPTKTKFETVTSIDEETYFYLEDSDSLAQDGRSMVSLSEKPVTKQTRESIKLTENSSLESSGKSDHNLGESKSMKSSYQVSESFDSLSTSDESKQSVDEGKSDEKGKKIEIKDDQVTGSSSSCQSSAVDAVQETMIIRSTNDYGSNLLIEENSTVIFKPSTDGSDHSSEKQSETVPSSRKSSHGDDKRKETFNESSSQLPDHVDQHPSSSDLSKSQIEEMSISFTTSQETASKMTSETINLTDDTLRQLHGYIDYSEYHQDEDKEEKFRSSPSSSHSSTTAIPSPLTGQNFDKLSRDIVDKGVLLRTVSAPSTVEEVTRFGKSLAGNASETSIIHHDSKVTSSLSLPEVIQEEIGGKIEEGDLTPDLSSPKLSDDDFIAKVETGGITLTNTFPTNVEMPSVHLRRSAQMAGQVLYEVPDEEDVIDSPITEKKQVGLTRGTTSSKEFPEVLHISEETTPSTPPENQSPKDIKGAVGAQTSSAPLPSSSSSSSTAITTSSFSITTSIDVTSPQDSKSGLCCFPRTVETDGTKKGKEEKVETREGRSSELVTHGVTQSHSLTEEQKKEKEVTLKEWGTPLGLPKPPDEPKPSVNRSSSKSRAVSSERTGSTRNSSTHRRSADHIKPVYIDLAYIPNHGDRHYCNVDFFKRIRARYYVLSGVNPSKEVLDALIEGKRCWEDKSAEVTLIPSHETEPLCLWMATNQSTLESLNIDVAPSASRCSVILQDQESSCSAYRVEF